MTAHNSKFVANSQHVFSLDLDTHWILRLLPSSLPATTLSGNKDSIYSLAMNDSGTILVSGSPEKVPTWINVNVIIYVGEESSITSST